jgi:formylglycine-generating enzyme required for sulfatase activity
MKLTLIRVVFYVVVGVFFLRSKPVIGQLPERETPKPKPTTPKPATPTVTRATVTVVWQGSGTVVIKMDDQRLIMKEGEQKTARLKIGDVLKIIIETPAKNYYATEFLMIEPGGGDLQVNLKGDVVTFDYETGAQKQARQKRMLLTIEQNMVFVEGDTFTMGCTSEKRGDCESDEKPVHTLTLSSFYISKYEVTQAQWVAIMGSNPSDFTGCDNCPVEMVSWDDVQEFIGRLNAATGKTFRLPTEAEWEYAARGGNNSKRYKYSGSDNINDVAWYVGNSGIKTHSVGSKQPNELGLYDMSGNVWEWCSDWYGGNYYGNCPTSNPQGPSSGFLRVLRGGCHYEDAVDCRVANRRGTNPGRGNYYFGFRLCLSQ